MHFFNHSDPHAIVPAVANTIRIGQGLVVPVNTGGGFYGVMRSNYCLAESGCSESFRYITGVINVKAHKGINGHGQGFQTGASGPHSGVLD